MYLKFRAGEKSEPKRVTMFMLDVRTEPTAGEWELVERR